MSDECDLTKEQQLENKFARIRKGTHWFKVIGGFHYFFGWLALFIVSIATGLEVIDGTFDFSEFIQNMWYVAITLIFGWCFMLLSDCMKAIDHLFNETKDVV
jgi:hypothetical protein